MMMIMKLQAQVTTEPRRSTRVCSAPEWYGNPVLGVLLLDHDEPTNYEEAMKYASSSNPSMDWCKHLGVGIYALMSLSKHIVLYRLAVKPVFTRK